MHKRRQWTCKPGSVCSHRRRGKCLSFIYYRCHHRSLSFYPPARASSPLFCSLVYMNFQLPACTASVSPLIWWALAPPSHPYPHRGGRFFSSALTDPCGPLSVRKRDALCCPDFPLPCLRKDRSATSRFTASACKDSDFFCSERKKAPLVCTSATFFCFTSRMFSCLPPPFFVQTSGQIRVSGGNDMP